MEGNIVHLGLRIRSNYAWLPIFGYVSLSPFLFIDFFLLYLYFIFFVVFIFILFFFSLFPRFLAQHPATRNEVGLRLSAT
ncbi:hypothetical protein BDV41DRAFT_545641, partial [Aspergillus transmontanensis]